MTTFKEKTIRDFARRSYGRQAGRRGNQKPLVRRDYAGAAGSKLPSAKSQRSTLRDGAADHHQAPGRGGRISLRAPRRRRNRDGSDNDYTDEPPVAATSAHPTAKRDSSDASAPL